jgi:hypothetical protein
MTTHAQSTQFQLTLTDKAAAEVRKFIAAEDVPTETAGLRISVMPGGCSGFKYSLNVEEKALEDDVVLDLNSVRVRRRVQPPVPVGRHGDRLLHAGAGSLHEPERPAAAGAEQLHGVGGEAAAGAPRGTFPLSLPSRPISILRRHGTLDLAVIVAYFALTIGVGLWVSRSQATAGYYFLGARNLPAWAVLFSIVATETSAITVISIPGLGARGDLSFLQLTFGYLVGRFAVALWLLPGYFRGDQETAYQRIETRFGPTSRRLVSVVFLVTRLLGDGVRILRARSRWRS